MDGSDWSLTIYLAVAVVAFVIALRRFERESEQKRHHPYPHVSRKADPLGLNIAGALSAAAFWPIIAICLLALGLGRLLTADLRRVPLAERRATEGE